MWSRVPPRSRASGTPARVAASAQPPISTAAFAMSWPRSRAPGPATRRADARTSGRAARRDPIADHVPRGVDGFRAVVRLLVGDALADPCHPSSSTVTRRNSCRHPPETGFEVGDERQPHPSQLDTRRCQTTALRLYFGPYFVDAVPVHRDRRPDRRRQDGARRSARRPARRHGRPRRGGQSVPRRFLRRAARVRRSRRSCSSRSRATGSRPRCARAISSAR